MIAIVENAVEHIRLRKVISTMVIRQLTENNMTQNMACLTKISRTLILVSICVLSISIKVNAYNAPVTAEGISPDEVSTGCPHSHVGGNGSGCYTVRHEERKTVRVFKGYNQCQRCGATGKEPCVVCGNPGPFRYVEIGWVNEEQTVVSWSPGCGCGSTDGSFYINRTDDKLTASVKGGPRISGTKFTWYCYDDGQLSETLTGASIPRNHESYSCTCVYTESLGHGGTISITGYKDDIHHVFMNETKPVQVYLNGGKVSGLYYAMPDALPEGKTKRNYLYFGH